MPLHWVRHRTGIFSIPAKELSAEIRLAIDYGIALLDEQEHVAPNNKITVCHCDFGANEHG